MPAADQFVLVGRIVTMAGAPDAEAVLISGGRIEAVGSRELAVHSRAHDIPVHDVGNRVVLPGFVDPHLHLDQLATNTVLGVDCRVPGCQTVHDVLDRLSDALRDPGPRDGWLIGYGNLFFDLKLADRRLPSRAELDQVSRTIPIVLHCGGHASIMNTAALEKSNLGRFISGTAGVWGTPVVRMDESGQPTGFVAEVDQLLPVPQPSGAEIAEELARTLRLRFTAHGVTTIGEISPSAEAVARLEQLTRSPEPPCRAVSYVMVPGAMALADALDMVTASRSHGQSDTFAIRGIKLFADGGYSARNAATYTPYLPEEGLRAGTKGRLNLGHGELVRTILLARERSADLAVHANGERAQDEVIRAVLAAGVAYGPPMVRLEHAGNLLTDERRLVAWREADLLGVLQPGFLHDFVGDFLPQVMGDAAARGRLPLRTLIDNAVPVAASSDVGGASSDQQSNPLFSVWCCLARRGFSGDRIEPDETITVPEALRLHTIEAARALGLDRETGSIEPGKFADFVVLDGDPRAVPVDDIPRLRVADVYLSGRSLTGAHAGHPT